MSSPLYRELAPLLDSPSAHAVREVPVQAGRRIWSFCPCHADGTKYGKRSLSLDFRYGLECFAGCEFRDVVRTIRERAGVYPVRTAPTQSLPQRRNGRDDLGDIVASWVYEDEEGQPLFRVLRTEGISGKEFPQQHPAALCAHHLGDTCKPAGKGWRWGRGGERYVLYLLPQLRRPPLNQMMFVVECER